MAQVQAGRGETIRCDVCVIGAGSAGLTAAAGAAQLGAKVVLIERGAMGGDCLNTGCVPSKALIAAAHAAHATRVGALMGVGSGAAPGIDFARVHDHVRNVIERIAPHDSVERFESLGVRVLAESARFVSRNEVAAGQWRIRARRFVIAAGSRPVLPDVPGLAETSSLTNETIFSLTELPRHLIVIGGGPIGMEMAQAFRRLGSEVTVVTRNEILPHDEPEAAALARVTLSAEGVVLEENAELTSVHRQGATIEVSFNRKSGNTIVTGSHVLVATGRAPNTEGLGLVEAGISFGAKGIEVDARLRTTNHKVFALGDIAGGPQFTHIAGYHAGIFVRNALFGLPAKVTYRALPWVTYLDPEIAHVGQTERDARRDHPNVQIITEQFSENDRAQTELRTDGFLKLVLGSGGEVLGVTIVAPRAGELISLWGLVIARRLPLSAIAGLIVPYPTLSELSRTAAASFFRPRLFNPRTRWLVAMLQRILP
jgi:pyruvate/2-oxoglutarate dehydrogenase complex dihydrolipoamide dehydrogenase (E3) component